MARAMIEIKTQPVQRLPCNDIQPVSGRSFFENRVRQSHISGKHCRIISFFFFRRLSENHRSCHIRSTLKIVGTRIHQKKSCMLPALSVIDLQPALFVGLVMNDSAMMGICYYRSKALTKI